MLKRNSDSRLFKAHHYRILFPLLGNLIGYLILHPYTMLVYTMTHPGDVHGTQFQWEKLHRLWDQALMAFHPYMLPMSIPFMFFGGITGVLLVIIFYRHKKIQATLQIF